MKNRSFLSVLSVLLLLCFCSISSAGTKPKDVVRRVAFFSLDKLGKTDPLYDQLQASLRKSVSEQKNVDVFDIALPSKCKSGDFNCLSSSARFAAADVLFWSSIEKFPDGGYATRIVLMNLETNVKKETKRISSSPSSLLLISDAVACELISVDACTGTIQVTGTENAQVIIDGKESGPIPFSSAIAIGQHSIRVVRNGLTTEERPVTLKPSDIVLLEVVLKDNLLLYADSLVADDVLAMIPDEIVTPPQPPPVPVVPIQTTPPHTSSPLKWIAGGVGVGALVVGAVLGGLAASNTDAFNQKFERRSLVNRDRDAYDSIQTQALGANVAYGLGLVGVGTAAVLFLTQSSQNEASP